jgi:hypothetical protein
VEQVEVGYVCAAILSAQSCISKKTIINVVIFVSLKNENISY